MNPTMVAKTMSPRVLFDARGCIIPWLRCRKRQACAHIESLHIFNTVFVLCKYSDFTRVGEREPRPARIDRSGTKPSSFDHCRSSGVAHHAFRFFSVSYALCLHSGLDCRPKGRGPCHRASLSQRNLQTTRPQSSDRGPNAATSPRARYASWKRVSTRKGCDGQAG